MSFFDNLKGKANELKNKAKDAFDDTSKDNELKKKLKSGDELSEEERNFFEEYNKKTPEEFTEEENNKFRPTKRTKYLWVDDNTKQWAYARRPQNVYAYSDLISYELIEDGDSVTKGGVSLGRAVVGGVLFSGVGMVLGGLSGKKKTKSFVNDMKINISVKNPDAPSIIIPLVKKKIKKDSKDYKKVANAAQETLNYLDMIAAYEEETNDLPNQIESNSTNKSIAEQLKEYKELLDMDIITQDEFDKKKEELLNL